MVQCAGGCAEPGREIFVAPPRIFKTGEEWILKQVRSSDADGYLVRNYDHLKFFADCRKRGDYTLNVANSLSADYFKNKFALERVTASYDLNAQQLEALLKGRATGSGSRSPSISTCRCFIWNIACSAHLSCLTGRINVEIAATPLRYA